MAKNAWWYIQFVAFRSCRCCCCCCENCTIFVLGSELLLFLLLVVPFLHFHIYLSNCEIYATWRLALPLFVLVLSLRSYSLLPNIFSVILAKHVLETLYMECTYKYYFHFLRLVSQHAIAKVLSNLLSVLLNATHLSFHCVCADIWLLPYILCSVCVCVL